MGRYWLGCSGWAYDDWVGPFYPPGTPSSDFLSTYARVFRTVEVDATFYRAPAAALVRRWAERTPEDFRFALKVPRDVTHRASSRGLPGEGVPDGELRGFLERLEPLRAAGKLGPLVLQFPASFRVQETGRLAGLLESVPREYALAVELRHSSWWNDATRALLERREAALVWSVVPSTRPPPWVTGGFLYARFVGDRALERFDRIQRDGRDELVRMRERFEDEGRSVATVFAFANNHFMGFGPGTVEALARVLGEPVPDLSAAGRRPGQARLSDGS